MSAAPNDKSSRLVEQTETSDVYANGDGTYKAVFYAGPVNFFDKATNQWRKLDKQFRQVGDRIENGAGPARVQLPTQMSAAAEVIVAKDDWSLSFAFTDATSTRPAKIVKGHVRYDDVAPGVSLDYRMLSNGLKEDIVLDQPRPAGSTATFRFRLSAQGITPVAVDGGTAVALQDAKGQEVARIPRGTMVDAKGLKGVVDMHLTNQNGAWSVDVAPDAAFLQGAAYPVRIDPAVIYTPLSPTDAFVDSICTTCNYGGLDFLKAGWVGNAQYYAYVRFPDLTRILGKGVTNAELRLQSSYEDDPSRFGLTALRTHGSWNASSITWANMANHGPERYDVDRNQQLGPAYYFPITSWAQGWAAGQDGDWINGKWSPRGATINTAGDNAFYQLGSAESTFTPEIPTMSVTYTNQTPNVITTLSPDDNWVGTASPALSAVFSDPDDTNGWIEYNVDGVLRGQFTTINGSTAPNFGLGAGPHTWQVRGVDANSYGPWSAQRSFTINVAPNMPDNLLPEDGAFSQASPTLYARYTASDSLPGSVQFEVAGVDAVSVPATANQTVSYSPNVTDGIYEWRVRAVDGLSASAWSPWRTFTVENQLVFYDGFTRNDGASWDSNKWTTSTSGSANVDVLQGSGRLRVSGTADAKAQGKGIPLSNAQALLTYQFENRAYRSGLRATLRYNGGSSITSGYRVEIQSDSSVVKLRRFAGGVNTETRQFNYTMTSLPQRLNFWVEGDTVRVKIWPVGSAEPTATSFEYVDPSPLPAGYFNLHHNGTSGARNVLIDDVALLDGTTFTAQNSGFVRDDFHWDLGNTDFIYKFCDFSGCDFFGHSKVDAFVRLNGRATDRLESTLNVVEGPTVRVKFRVDCRERAGWTPGGSCGSRTWDSQVDGWSWAHNWAWPDLEGFQFDDADEYKLYFTYEVDPSEGPEGWAKSPRFETDWIDCPKNDRPCTF